jgi:hypothetical protein
MTEQVAVAAPVLTEPADILAEMDRVYDQFMASVAGLSDAQKLEPGATGRWRVKDVLSHLARWDDVAYEEIEAALGGERTGKDYRNYLDINEVWVVEDWERPLDEVEHHFAQAHARVMARLRPLPYDQWQRYIKSWAKNAIWHHYPEHTAWLWAWRRERGY